MQPAGDLPISPALFVAEDNGGSPMEYVLAASIIATLGGMLLLAMARAW